MKGDSAQLPVDFLVGFTLFILSLIMVANYVPSLLVGLQRTTGIDYDAVAYRTGVVLVEDPGEPPGIPIGTNPGEYSIGSDWRPWEYRESKDQISRFGLALDRDTPNILSINKINRFFCTTFFSDADYRSKLLFSSYQYGYNITIKNLSPMKPGEPLLNLSIGEPYPAGYGYIRRYVVIKQDPNATINMATPATNNKYNARSGDQLCAVPSPCQERFTIRLTGSMLYNNSIGTPYKLDLQREPLIINITGLHTLLNNSDLGFNPNPYGLAYPTASPGWSDNTHGLSTTAPHWANLTAVDFGTPEDYNLWTTMMPGVNIANESGPQAFPVPDQGIKVFDSIYLSMNYVDADFFGVAKNLDITFTFNDNPDLPHTLINGTYSYDYDPANVTQPVLSTGMLEVGIW
jgi:hypothetical protein